MSETRFEVAWNGDMSNIDLAIRIVWGRMQSLDCTRVVSTKMDKHIMRDLPMPVFTESESDDDSEDESEVASVRNTPMRSMEHEITSQISMSDGESNVASDSDDSDESTRVNSPVISSVSTTANSQDAESLLTADSKRRALRRKKKKQERRNALKKANYYRDYKIWSDHRRDQVNYERQWRSDEGKAWRVLNESLGASGKALIKEFRPKVGEDTLGQPARIWEAWIKLNDVNPIYSAADVIKNIVNLRVLGRNFAVFCETFDRYVESYEVKTSTVVNESMLLAFFSLCLEGSDLSEDFTSALQQFRRDGVDYTNLRRKLILEDSRAKSKRVKPVKQVAMLAENKDNRDNQSKSGKGKPNKRTRNKVEAAETQVEKEVITCAVASTPPSNICPYCKRDHAGGEKECWKKAFDLAKSSEKKVVDAKLSVIECQESLVRGDSTDFKLDTCASMHVTGNIQQLENISKGDRVKIKGFDGNCKVSDTYGDIPELGRAVYIEGMPSTLISFGELKDNGFKASYDDSTMSFELSKDDVKLKFHRNESNTWSGDFVEAFECVACDSETVEVPKIRSTTNEEAERFKRIDALHRDLHHPADAVLRRMLKTGKILNTVCVSSDVDKYREVMGPCEGCAKGKMTKRAAHPSLTPRSSSNGELVHVDLMFFVGYIFLIAVDDYSRKKFSVEVASKQKADILKAVQLLRNSFLESNFGMIEIRHDGEASLVNSVDDMNQLFIKTSLSTPGDHTSIAEVAIRVIKNKARATVEGLGFKLPAHLVPYLISDVIFGMNMTLAEDRDETPNEIYHGRKFDVATHGRAQFGDFGYFRCDPKADKGNLAERATLGMVVGRVSNGGGSVRVFQPSRGTVVIRYKFQPAKLDTATRNFILQTWKKVDESELEPDEELVTEIQEDAIAMLASVQSIENQAANNCFPHWIVELHAYLAIEESRRTEADESKLAEMKQMIEEDVFESVDINSLTEQDFIQSIPSHMFTKEKLNPAGEFIKFKSRLVAGGHREIIEIGMDNSSPTAAKEALFAALGLASNRAMTIQSIDIKGAYLKAELPRRQFMHLNKKLSNMLCDIDPKFEKCRDSKGCCLVKLKKALYGLKESAKLWYETLSSVLIECGYTADTQDACVFHKTTTDGDISVICIHVDDLLCVADKTKDLDYINDVMRAKFTDITVDRGDKISYLGMTIERSADGREIKVSQSGYIKSMLAKFEVTKRAKSPSTKDFFERGTEEELVDPSLFLSKLMSCMYLAIGTRMDILKEVVFLATKCKCPIKSDMIKIDRILAYINGTSERVRVFKVTDLSVWIYIDAAYGVHQDGKSHSGCVVTLGENGGTVDARSSKQSLVTLSSTEAEMVAVHDMIMRGLVICRYYNNWKVPYRRYNDNDSGLGLKVLQDNTSAVHMMMLGRPNSFKSRHIGIRYYHTKEMVENGDVMLEYCPTENMKADVMTKPMGGELFVKMVKWLLND